jgi:uncharacterized repeat protein (TIGR01451 family)
MKTTTQLLGAVSAFALVVMSSAPALAATTQAGATITNEVSVTFDVGGVTQNAQTAFDEMTVDRKVNINVEYVGPATSVTPGQDNAVIAFDVTNLSNDTIDLALAATLTAGTPTNIDNFRIYADANGNSTYDAGVDTLVTHLDELVEDQTVRVFVVADIDINATNANIFDLALTATAHEGDTLNALGDILVATSGADTDAMDTVFADGDGDEDGNRDGAFSDTGTYTVAGAVVTLLKTSTVLSDPVNGAVNPKAIPGATVKYCITVANASGAAPATAVSVVDTLPTDVTFIDGSSIVDGDATCNGGTAGGTYDNINGILTAAVSDVDAGVTRSVYFQVLIN